jgi:hypothetical protein
LKLYLLGFLSKSLPGIQHVLALRVDSELRNIQKHNYHTKSRQLSTQLSQTSPTSTHHLQHQTTNPTTKHFPNTLSFTPNLLTKPHNHRIGSSATSRRSPSHPSNIRNSKNPSHAFHTYLKSFHDRSNHANNSIPFRRFRILLSNLTLATPHDTITKDLEYFNNLRYINIVTY